MILAVGTRRQQSAVSKLCSQTKWHAHFSLHIQSHHISLHSTGNSNKRHNLLYLKATLLKHWLFSVHQCFVAYWLSRHRHVFSWTSSVVWSVKSHHVRLECTNQTRATKSNQTNDWREQIGYFLRQRNAILLYFR